MNGSLLVVTLMGNGSISDAHNGFMPDRIPPKGNPPDPSKRLPNVSSGIGSPLQLAIFMCFPVSDQAYRTICACLFNKSLHYHITDLLLKLHNVTDTLGLLTGDQRTATPSERVQDDAVAHA